MNSSDYGDGLGIMRGLTKNSNQMFSSCFERKMLERKKAIKD